MLVILHLRHISVVVQMFMTYSMPAPSCHTLFTIAISKVSVNDVWKVVQRVTRPYCDNDPVPISDIVKSDIFHEMVNFLMVIVNATIDNINFPETEKVAVIKPILF